MSSSPAAWWQRFQTHVLSLQRHELLIILGALGCALIPFISADKTDVSNGFPGDAGVYGYLAQDFPGRWREGINSFYLGRSLPSLFLYFILRLLFNEPSNSQVLVAFGLLNVAAMTLTGYVWCLVTRHLKIGISGAGLGFIGIFLNHHVMKTSGQSPILTDFCAYALGLLLFYVYLKRKAWGIWIVTILLTFTWPSGIYMCTLLLLFPCPQDIPTTPPPSKVPPYKLHYILALLPTIAAFIYMQELLPGDLDYLGRGVPLERVGYLSIAIATIYLFWGLSELLRNATFYRWSTWSPYLFSWQFWLKLAGLAILFKIPGLLATDGGYPMTLGHLLYLIVLMSILQPGVFWVAHIVYFGPILIFALFFWRPICRWIHAYGGGFTAWVAIMFVLSLDSESRHLVNFYPVLITFVVLATESLRKSWQTWHYWALGILGVVTSKFWLSFLRTASNANNPRQFPSQLYFMHHGPWMSNLMYVIQGAVVLLLMYGIYDLFIRDFRPRRSANSQLKPQDSEL